MINLFIVLNSIVKKSVMASAEAVATLPSHRARKLVLLTNIFSAFPERMKIVRTPDLSGMKPKTMA